MAAVAEAVVVVEAAAVVAEEGHQPPNRPCPYQHPKQMASLRILVTILLPAESVSYPVGFAMPKRSRSSSSAMTVQKTVAPYGSPRSDVVDAG